MFRLALVTIGLLASMAKGQAAEITVERAPSDPGAALIWVRGDLASGDGRTFAAAARRLDRATVTFDSEGGSLEEARIIGGAISVRGFDTRVDAGASCTSACALAWLGGRTRAVARSARVAFGGADGSTDLDDALAGAYLTRLGLSEAAVAFVISSARTEAPIDLARAQESGIAIALLRDSFEDRGGATGSLPREPLGIVVPRPPQMIEAMLIVRGLGPLAVLAVRLAPDGNAPIKDRLADGARVAWLGSEGPWRAVRLPNGETGWAHAKYLEPFAPFPPHVAGFAPDPGPGQFR